MFKHSPGRNQRSKGNTIKHGLQVCFLVAVCFWLMYQVKHSYDKKKELDESDVQRGLTTKITTDATKLGRKDLKPKMEETVSTNEVLNEEQEEETAEEEEKSNNEESGGGGEDVMMEDGKDEEENIIKENIKIDSNDSSDPLENEKNSADQNAISGIERREVTEDDRHLNTNVNDAVNNNAVYGATFGDVSGLQTIALNQGTKPSFSSGNSQEHSDSETTSETGDSRDNTADINDKTTMMEEESLKTEIPDEVQQDPKEFSDSITGLAEKDVQTGLEKLAETLIEGDDEDMAAE